MEILPDIYWMLVDHIIYLGNVLITQITQSNFIKRAIDFFQGSAENCSKNSPKTMFELFKEINDEFLAEVFELIRSNPECSMAVKCELATFIPKLWIRLVLNDLTTTRPSSMRSSGPMGL